MKRVLAILLLVLLLSTAVAETVERNMLPEAGQGWLAVTIHGVPVEFEYTGFTKSMSDTVYSFEAESYTLNIVFNSKLVVGETMGENSIKSLELMSRDSATSGYYLVKKSTASAVESQVTIEKDENGILQGVFEVMVHPTDRYVGDNKPGMIQDLAFTDGSFCFNR